MPLETLADCNAVNAELDRLLRGEPMSPQARHHLVGCARCRMIYEALRAEPSLPPPPAEASQQVLANIQQSLKPVQRIKSRTTLTTHLVLVFLLLAAALTSIMNRVGIDAMSAVELFGISAIFALGVIVLTQSLARQMTPGSVQWIPAPAAMAILAIGVLAAFVLLFPWRTPEAFFARGLHCLRVGVVLAIPTGALFWFLARRGAPLDLMTLGATLGAIAGLLAVTVLQFTCNLQDVGHLLTWHGGVLLISTIAGGLIGRFCAAYRSRRAT